MINVQTFEPADDVEDDYVPPENKLGIAQEMACLTRLCHKNLIRLNEIIDDPKSKKVYLVMNFCSGGTLAQKLEASKNGLPEEEVREYFRSLISAIHYCLVVHQISHRDVKPENLMLDEAGQVYLSDFGCSEFFKKDEDLSKATKGTYLFMAPEMFEGNKEKKIVKGHALDIWAAGVTLYNLLTNEHPYKVKSVFELMAKVKKEKPNIDGLGEGREDLKKLLERLLEKDPEKRIKMDDIIMDPWVT